MRKPTAMASKSRGRAALLRPLRVQREDVQQNPEILWVFGDNMARAGLGGQAAAMRGEPNAHGVPTKWLPESRPGAYFTDADWRNPVNPTVREAVTEAFRQIEEALVSGRDVAIPRDGIGTGLAQLPRRAPTIHAYISGEIARLEREYPAPVEAWPTPQRRRRA